MAVVPDYQINGVSLPCPSDAKWNIPGVKGIRGDGLSLYDPYYTFDFTWDYLDPDDYNTLFTTWQGTYNSGTAACKLPQYGFGTYQFQFYSGVLVDMPIPQAPYNFEHYANVRMSIRKINIG